MKIQRRFFLKTMFSVAAISTAKLIGISTESPIQPLLFGIDSVPRKIGDNMVEVDGWVLHQSDIS